AVGVALELARMSPPLEVDLAFAAPSPSPSPTPSPSPSPSYDDLRRAFDAVKDVGVFGALKRKERTVAVATAAGLRCAHTSASVQLEAIAQIDDGSAWAGHYAPADQPVDITDVVARAADAARRSRNPVTIDPGPRDVVLAPAAVAELLEWMALASFGARSVIDGQSLLGGRAGELICSPRVTIAEATPPGELPFDAEGVRRQAVDFIRDGRAGHAVSDLVSAARLADGRGSTGHAAPISQQNEATTPTPAHVVLAPGAHTEDELIAMVERGIYVTRLHYVNGLLDTRRATMTGMTRNGTFTIEDGRLGRAAVNLRFTDSILDALSEERLGGIGRTLRATPTWWSAAGQTEAPALLLRRFQWSGASR
ncbi:MAG TPA: metallopeptidase TldD-related protein, partial [Kofleriaceae bacterium]|nr:metallopeptidase TldD-related protein [Kofleriaceae bacterium]